MRLMCIETGHPYGIYNTKDRVFKGEYYQCVDNGDISEFGNYHIYLAYDTLWFSHKLFMTEQEFRDMKLSELGI
jgi:hypothetical protein